MFALHNDYSLLIKADPWPAQMSCAPLVWKFWGVVFYFITRIYFKCSQHTMIAVCILFFTFTTKTQGIKMISRPQEFYSAWTAQKNSRFEIPWSATGWIWKVLIFFFNLNHVMEKNLNFRIPVRRSRMYTVGETQVYLIYVINNSVCGKMSGLLIFDRYIICLVLLYFLGTLAYI